MSNHMMKTKTSNALLEILRISAEQNFTMSRTRVAKLLYLADLESVRRTGHQGTDLEWIWYNYGPYDNDLLVIERTLAENDQIECENAVVAGGGRMFTEKRMKINPAAGLPQSDIDDEFISILRETVERYGSWSATAIKDFTYATPPMMKAQREGRRGDALALDLVEGKDKVKPHLPNMDKYRQILASRPQRDRDQDLSWMREEYEAARPSIDRADALVS